MAVPTMQPETSRPRPPTSRFPDWAQRLGSGLSRPLFAIVLAMVASAIVIVITAPGSFEGRFFTVLQGFQSLFTGSFGDPINLSYTLTRVTALIFTGLSIGIAYRAGLFNIGAQGQLTVGAMTAGIIAFSFSSLPGWILIPLMIIGSALAGALWGGIVGILKAWRGAHEVVTTIMLNWIAFYLADYFIAGPLKAPNQANQTAALPTQATIPLVSTFYNQTLGTIFGPIANPTSYTTDMSFFLALLGLVLYWFIVSRTAFGYEIRVIGQNLKAARYAGIPIKRNLFLVMALSGAFSGLAGSLRLMGQFPYQLIGTTFSIDPTGFDAIGVALLGRTTAIGVFLGALLFGGLRQGGSFMQIDANIPGDLVYIIQALVLFSIAAEFLPVIQRALPNLSRFGRRPALAPAIAGQTASDEVPVVNETTHGESKAVVERSPEQAELLDSQKEED